MLARCQRLANWHGTRKVLFCRQSKTRLPYDGEINKNDFGKLRIKHFNCRSGKYHWIKGAKWRQLDGTRWAI